MSVEKENKYSDGANIRHGALELGLDCYVNMILNQNSFISVSAELKLSLCWQLIPNFVQV